MRIEPAELPVVEPSMQGDLVAGIFRNVETIVRRVRRARRNQMDVDNGTSRPGVAFIDGIAVPINLQGAIEVRTRLDRALAIVFDSSAPDNRFTFFVGDLQLKPDIESDHRT